MPRLGLRLTPHGRLVAEDQDDAPEIDATAHIRLAEAFAEGSGAGLMRLGAGEVGQALPPVFVWWRAFATRYVGAVCMNASGRDDDMALPPVPPPDAGDLASLVLAAPLMAGAEYLTDKVLFTLWDEMALAFLRPVAGLIQPTNQRRPSERQPRRKVGRCYVGSQRQSCWLRCGRRFRRHTPNFGWWDRMGSQVSGMTSQTKEC